MKNTKRIAVVAAALSTLVLGALPARADMVVKRDAQNNVYVAGMSAGASTEVNTGGSVRTRNVQANNCGVVRIGTSLAYSSATKVSLGGTESIIADLPVKAPGGCTLSNGSYVATNAPTETRFKDAIGNIYIQGLNANSTHTVSYPDLLVTRRATANACGYFRIANSTSSPITDTTTLKIGSTSYTVGSLATVLSPGCRRISDTQSVMVVPITEATSWSQ